MINDEDDFYDETLNIKLRRFPGSHLSAPLTYYPQRLIIKHYEENSVSKFYNVNDAVDQLRQIQTRHKKLKLTDDSSFINGKIFESCYKPVLKKYDFSHQREIRNILVSSIRETKTNFSTLSSANPGLKDMKVDLQESDVARIINSIYPAFISFRMLTRMRSKIQQCHVGGDFSLYGPTDVGGINFYHAGEILYCIYGSKPLNCCILNYDQLVMLADTVSSRFLALLTTLLNDARYYDKLPSYRLLVEVYSWGDEVLVEAGMAGYTVIGEYESFITSMFVTFQDADILKLGEEYHQSVLLAAEENEKETGVKCKWTLKILGILSNVNSSNVLSELFGLRKHWGNPVVEAAASGRAVQEKLDENLDISFSALLNLKASFNRMITLEFIKKNQVWPKCTFSATGDTPCPIRDAWLHNVIRVPENHPDHSHFHWTLMKFEKNCVLQDYKDQLSTLSDKAVSLPVDELDLVFFGCDRKNHPNSGNLHERRLMIEYLRKDHLSVNEILERVMSNDIPANWLANSAAMKGTEMKYKKARIFAVLTFELRQYFSVTEDMIKEHIFPYNPHQTMTMTEVNLLQKLREITKQMDVTSTSKTLNVIHIIDFSKWNLRMRYSNTAFVFRSIDDFMGTPGLIEQSHIIFEAMTNIVQDPYNAPEKPVAETSSDTIWRAHTRGWEGQRQKGWTAMTSALLSDLERRTGIKSQICGQGDNQVLLTQFPIPDGFKNANDWVTHDPEQVRRILDDFYVKLEESCNAVGLKVKTAESCRSLHYLNYGKRLYFNGSELSMCIKRIAKILTEPNDSFPTSEAKLKTAQGSAYAASLYSNPSPWPYLMSKFATNLLLWESFVSNALVGEFGKYKAMEAGIFKTRMISIMTKIPQSLGGPPQQSFSSFFCRGHPDPLCEDLTPLVMNANEGCLISQAIIKCAREGIWFNEPDEDRSTLILSPYSLNLDVPTSAKAPVAKSVLPALKGMCKNESVNEVLSLEVDDYEEELYACLSKMSPFNPLVANDIFSRSIPGKRQNFVNGLKNSTSLCRIVKESPYKTILEEIITLEGKQLEFWIRQVEDVTDRMLPEFDRITHYELAQELRDKSWGVEVVGVTVPHPCEIFRIVEADDDVCDHHEKEQNSEHLLIVQHSDELYAPVGGDSNSIQLTRSRTGRPYLGNTISEGLFSKQMVCLTHNKAWEDACRLNIVRRWVCNADSKLNDIIESVIKTRTDAPLTVLNMITGHPHRLCYSHRANLMAVKKTCSITTTSNMMTRLYISSNRMGEFSSGDMNYHLPYGPAFVTMGTMISVAGVLSLGEGWKPDSTKIYHCHLRYRNIPVVYDGRLSCDYDSLPTELKPPSQFYSPLESMVFEDASKKCSGFFTKNCTSASRLEAMMAYGSILLGDDLVREISMKELNSSSLVNAFPSRSSNITTNDIKLTGVIGLVRAISTMLLINAPLDFSSVVSKEPFLVSVRLMCDGLTDSFWTQFTNVMIHKNVILKLRRLSRINSPGYSTSDLDSLSSTLKTAVCVDAWEMKQRVLGLSLRNLDNLITLVVPNDSAARHLLGKCYCLFFWSMCNVSKIHKGAVIQATQALIKSLYSNKQSETIHDLFADLNIALCKVCDEFKIPKLLGRFPHVVILNQNQPWVDRLRSDSIVFEERLTGLVYTSKERRHCQSSCTAIRIGEKEIVIKPQKCCCREKVLINSHHVDAFYIRTGVYGSYHIFMLDVLMLHELNVSAVAVFGDPEGEIALQISRLEDNEKIYVASARLITSYSPHVASTAIPTAFFDSSTQEKLFLPSEANVIGDPLKSKESLKRACSHLADLETTGIVINATSNDNMRLLNDGDFEDTLSDLLMVCKDLKWCVLLIRATCKHKLTMAVSSLGKFFELVSVCKSIVHRPSLNVMAVIADVPRMTPLHKAADSVFLTVSTNKQVADLICTDPADFVPTLMRAPKAIQDDWMSILEDMPSNLGSLCGAYIPGWGVEYDSFEDKNSMIESLKELQEEFLLELNRLSRVTSRIKEGKRLARSEVLCLSNPNRTDQYLNISRLWLKSKILKEVLMIDEGNILKVVSRIDDILSVEAKVFAGGKMHTISMPSNLFKKESSGLIFGILGHIWCNTIIKDEKENQKMTHLGYVDRHAHKKFKFPIYLNMTIEDVVSTDRSFLWKTRAKIVSVLMVIHMTKSVPSVNYPLKAIVSKLKMTISESLQDYTEHGVNLMWLTDFPADDLPLSDLCEKSIEASNLPCYAVISSIHYRQFQSWFKIEKCIRVPWSGLEPDFFLVQYSMKTIGVGESDCDMNVNFRTTVGVIYDGLLKTGCMCYDCSTESFLVSSLGVEIGLVDSVCKTNQFETVDDINHNIH